MGFGFGEEDRKGRRKGKGYVCRGHDWCGVMFRRMEAKREQDMGVWWGKLHERKTKTKHGELGIWGISRFDI